MFQIQLLSWEVQVAICAYSRSYTCVPASVMHIICDWQLCHCLEQIKSRVNIAGLGSMCYCSPYVIGLQLTLTQANMANRNDRIYRYGCKKAAISGPTCIFHKQCCFHFTAIQFPPSSLLSAMDECYCCCQYVIPHYVCNPAWFRYMRSGACI